MSWFWANCYRSWGLEFCCHRWSGHSHLQIQSPTVLRFTLVFWNLNWGFFFKIFFLFLDLSLLPQFVCAFRGTDEVPGICSWLQSEIGTNLFLEGGEGIFIVQRVWFFDVLFGNTKENLLGSQATLWRKEGKIRQSLPKFGFSALVFGLPISLNWEDRGHFFPSLLLSIAICFGSLTLSQEGQSSPLETAKKNMIFLDN